MITTVAKPTQNECQGMKGIFWNTSGELRVLEMLLRGPMETCRHTHVRDEVVESMNNKLLDLKYNWRVHNDGEFLSLVPTGAQPPVSTTC